MPSLEVLSRYYGVPTQAPILDIYLHDERIEIPEMFENLVGQYQFAVLLARGSPPIEVRCDKLEA